jgi:hypothetical protein
MKKLLLIVSLLLLSTAVFASTVQLGVSALYTTPITPETSIESFNTLGIEDFRFGADARFNLGGLRIGVQGFFEAAGADALAEPSQLEIIATLGLNLELAIIQIGLGAGPSFALNLGDPDIPNPVDIGVHAQGTFNINLGPISLGALVGTSLDFTNLAEDVVLGRSMDFYAGLSVLFNL